MEVEEESSASGEPLFSDDSPQRQAHQEPIRPEGTSTEHSRLERAQQLLDMQAGAQERRQAVLARLAAARQSAATQAPRPSSIASAAPRPSSVYATAMPPIPAPSQNHSPEAAPRTPPKRKRDGPKGPKAKARPVWAPKEVPAPTQNHHFPEAAPRTPPKRKRDGPKGPKAKARPVWAPKEVPAPSQNHHSPEAAPRTPPKRKRDGPKGPKAKARPVWAPKEVPAPRCEPGAAPGTEPLGPTKDAQLPPACPV